MNTDLALALEYCEKSAELGNYHAYGFASEILYFEMGDIVVISKSCYRITLTEKREPKP